METNPILLTSLYSEVENDCACADKAFSLVHDSHDVVSTFSKTEEIKAASLVRDFHLVYSPYAPEGPSVLNKDAWERWQTFVNPQLLSQKIDHKLAEQMLIYPTNQPLYPQAGQAVTLTAWVHVTNACNLDCPYCYVRKSSARMSESIGIQAIDSIFKTAKRNGFRRVKLKYAGGEATLHFKLIRRLHSYAKELSLQMGIDLAEVVLSNGVRLRVNDALWLKKNRIKLMISIDGIGELHNQLRPLPTQRPYDTFQHVAHTIDAILLPLGIKPDISMTITGVNAHGAADVAKWALIDRDLPLSFNFYRENLASASFNELTLEEDAIIEGMLEAYNVIEKYLPERPFLDGLLDRVQTEAHTHTCGVGQSYLVITHTGHLVQCQMHLDQPVTPHLDQDLLIPVRNGKLKNLSVHDKEGCQTCEFRYRCSGGCPLETFRATGRWDVQSPNCNIYKTLYPKALRLEGLRILKINGLLQ